MDWINRLEASIDYIEDHLTDTLDHEELGRIAYCSAYHYQRIFSYMVDVPLAEYIRRRKMTLAGMDLQQGAKVIDVALKYGYESPNSFGRAFKQQHGITPSQAQQEGVTLTAFPRIKFHIMIKGDVEMNYRIETKEAFKIIGASLSLSREIEENFKEVPAFWGKFSADGTLGQLIPLMNTEIKGVLGVSAGFGKPEDKPTYYIGVASDAEVPVGLESYEVPACTWAIFPGTGTMPASIQELEKRIYTEWLPSSGYQYGNGADIEVYINADPTNAVFEVWMPVEKAK